MTRGKQQSQQPKQHGQEIQHETRADIRLNKYISDTGFCSRREADRIIEAGRVTVDGVLAPIGLRVTLDQEVAVDGKVLTLKTEKVYIALNKPVGITCTTDTAIPGNLTSFMKYPEIIFPIGRLDKDSSGLLLMTSDGDIVNKILREENGHDKEYRVTVNRKFDESFLRQMAQGVEIFNPVADKHQCTLPCQITAVDERTFKLVLRQGLNRQIRRMCQALGYKVVKLRRERIMNVRLGNLGEGQWRYLTGEELSTINAAINQQKETSK